MRRTGAALLAAALVCTAACRSSRVDVPRDEEIPLSRALIAVGDAGDGRAALESLAKVAARVRDDLRRDPRRPRVEVINETLFEGLAFTREIDDTNPRFMRLGSVLDGRKGSCLGLAALYLALGEWLGPGEGFSVQGVLVPGHFFVRVSERGGPPRNVELLRRGEEMPDAWYRERYQLPPEGEVAPAYLRPLKTSEVLGVFDYNLGNDLRRRNRLPAARAAYERAATAFPSFAEAHASLGLVLHLTGDLPAAARAYAAARAANPTLPGLDKNMAVLREEMSAAK